MINHSFADNHQPHLFSDDTLPNLLQGLNFSAPRTPSEARKMGLEPSEPLSIGVEIEAVYESNFPDHPDATTALQQVQSILDGIFAENVELQLYWAQVFGGPKAQQTGHTTATAAMQYPKNTSFVTLDEGVIPDDKSKQHGVKITPPIFTNGAWKTVLPIMMNGLQKSGKFKVNGTTGLHIHVRRGEYSLDDFKKVSMAIALFEPQMGILPPKLKSLSARQIIEIIDSTSKRGVVLRWMQHGTEGKDSSRNSNTYDLRGNNLFCTIEFRQAAGTLDPIRIVESIESAIRFVEKACQTEKNDFLKMAGGIKEGDYRDFGVPKPF